MIDATVPQRVGRYSIGPEIASGGMAVIRLGQLKGPGGFCKLVAIKQLHPELAAEPGFAALLVEEARLNSAISHPNVVSIFDVLEQDGRMLLVMDYVNGETLAQLLRLARKRSLDVPIGVVRRMLSDVLHGLHAAHVATNADGVPLGVIHRDVSPQNIMIGVDGIARVLDFGVAKTAFGPSHTAPGKVKGKLAYMAPEQIRQQPLDARTDVFAAGVVLWEALSGRRLFAGEGTQGAARLLSGPVALVAEYRSEISMELDRVIQKALACAMSDRFSSARDFAEALEATGTLASRAEVGAWVQRMAGDALELRSRSCAEPDAGTVRLKPSPILGSIPRARRGLYRWLRADGGYRSAALAAAAGLVATAAACLAFVKLEIGSVPTSSDTTPTHPALVLAAGPCAPSTAPSQLEPPLLSAGASPPLRPESLRLEGRPRVRGTKSPARNAPRPVRSASDVLGF